jgi:hypothetical protein
MQKKKKKIRRRNSDFDDIIHFHDHLICH